MDECLNNLIGNIDGQNEIASEMDIPPEYWGRNNDRTFHIVSIVDGAGDKKHLIFQKKKLLMRFSLKMTKLAKTLAKDPEEAVFKLAQKFGGMWLEDFFLKAALPILFDNILIDEQKSIVVNMLKTLLPTFELSLYTEKFKEFLCTIQFDESTGKMFYETPEWFEDFRTLIDNTLLSSSKNTPMTDDDLEKMATLMF